ncbi:MAG: hypothetical protein FGM50_12400, partial [Mycobacterium sp.]|nr:hypothetical protein [Mycobacterium sp.]
MAGQARSKSTKTGTRKARRTLQPYAWLGAGALTLGVSAALAGGAGIAHADSQDAAGPTGRAATGERATAGATRPDKTRGGASAARAAAAAQPVASGVVASRVALASLSPA